MFSTLTCNDMHPRYTPRHASTTVKTLNLVAHDSVPRQPPMSWGTGKGVVEGCRGVTLSWGTGGGVVEHIGFTDAVPYGRIDDH